MARVPIVTDITPFFLGAVFFAEDGKTIETVVVSESLKPAGANTSGWQELGAVENAKLTREVEGGVTRYVPNLVAGKWEKKKKVGRTTSLSIDLTFQEVSEFVHRVMWNAASIDTGDGEFVPNSQPEGIYRGWLLVQQQNGDEVTTVAHLRIELEMTNAAEIINRTGAMPQLKLDVIDNDLNVGNFGTTT